MALDRRWGSQEHRRVSAAGGGSQLSLWHGPGGVDPLCYSVIASPWAALVAVTRSLQETGLAMSFSAARVFATQQVASVGMLREQSLRRMVTLWDRFDRFAHVAFGVVAIGDVSTDVAKAFVTAKTTEGLDPNVATMHLRRSAVRLLFRVLRQFGVPAGDPTLDLVLPPRSSLDVRPLSDDEVELCRWFSLATLVATRQPAAWALAEAGATTSEVPAVTIKDVSLERRSIWLSGGTRTTPRWGPLTDWGVLQVARRIEALECADPSTRLVYEGWGSPESRQASSCAAVHSILRRAGLSTEPDVRPRSVRAWLARRTLEDSGHIEDVARLLGLRSLDAAAALVGWDWTKEQ